MSTSSTNKLLEGLDADDPATRAVVFELHATVRLGEDGVVLTEPGVEAGAKAPSALAHDDGAAGHDVAVVCFHAEPLRVRIAAVARTALSFFMSHVSISAGKTLQKDVLDPHLREEGAMTLGPAHSLAALFLEDANFRP